MDRTRGVTSAVLMLALLFLSQARLGSGQVFEGIYAGQRCRCHKRTSAFIHPKMYTRLEIFPKGISCQREEVIITLLSGKMVCVEPDAKWLKTILGYLDRKKKRHERSK
ncbi:C-X-C motif chemokine 13 [Pleurodeles waltl]|uniref:C-X-C motif chemokine 13 n=1 Tax=Pleurodeles waltl TaxID=8319 RepID=UPI0037099982